jgi:hypothetical protein
MHGAIQKIHVVIEGGGLAILHRMSQWGRGESKYITHDKY